MIDVRNLTKEYDPQTRALDRVSMSVEKGEWVSIMGPSGSGKTTLLNILGCLDNPTGGSVKVGGTPITSMDRHEMTEFRCQNIGLVFQSYNLIPYLTALENVLLAQYFAGVVDEEDAMKVLRDVGMENRVDHLPTHLSGGEQQRVCIARALVNAPRLLLADEPTGNLDTANGAKVLSLMRRLHEKGHTIVMVTHNDAVAAMGDRVLKLVDGKLVSDTKTRGKAPGPGKMKIESNYEKSGTKTK